MRPAPERELVPLGQHASVRTHVHDYPHPLARWHHHPEIEIHLIADTSGTAHIGGAVRGFRPGSLYLVGGGIPHNWVSALSHEGIVRGRDVLAHIDPGVLENLIRTAPELRHLETLIKESAYGIEFFGATRDRAEELLRSARGLEGPSKLLKILDLLVVMSEAPQGERSLVDPEHSSQPLPAHEVELFDTALGYVYDHLDRPLSLKDVAGRLGLTEPQVSRLFTKATSDGFSRTIIRLRVTEACRLLRITDAASEKSAGRSDSARCPTSTGGSERRRGRRREPIAAASARHGPPLPETAE